ncbi:hypothetical protein ACXJJ3_42120 (plasmid) [Kribbella sp. WER1]
MTTDQARAHERALDLASADGRAAGHHQARTTNATFVEPPLPNGEKRQYQTDTVEGAFRAAFDAGYETWVNHCTGTPAPLTAPFQPYDAAALAQCLRNYDALQRESAKVAELFAKAEQDRTRYAEADEQGHWHDIDARLLLDDMAAAIQGPPRTQRVHYSELNAGDIVTDHGTQFKVIARGECMRGRHVAQWVSTEAVTQPSSQLHPFVTEIGDTWRLQAREDLAYAHRITPANPLTH